MKLSRADFDRLPRHPSYKYELIGGETRISPWPRYARAELRLSRYRPDAADLGTMKMRPARTTDVEALTPIFCGAFGHRQPYGSLDDEALHKAAETSLRRTFTGHDGPWVEAASFVALEDDKVAGAILITLLPGGDAADEETIVWREPPPADLWKKGEGQPHLTWIFVSRFRQGQGAGTRLLQQAVRVLKKQGYKTLWTTFLIGNESSMLWHWRNGFELGDSVYSKRRMRRELKIDCS
jgi:GNAT superfamily N-acetyltransferase